MLNRLICLILGYFIGAIMVVAISQFIAVIIDIVTNIN